MTKFLRPKFTPDHALDAPARAPAVRSSDASVRLPDSANPLSDAGVDDGPDILIRISAPRTRPPLPADGAPVHAGGVPNPPVPLRAGMAHICATGSGPTPSTSVSSIEVRPSGAMTYDVVALNEVVAAWA